MFFIMQKYLLNNEGVVEKREELYALSDDERKTLIKK
jgi:hypothetical protein